jgi:hypothetical protein
VSFYALTVRMRITVKTTTKTPAAMEPQSTQLKSLSSSAGARSDKVGEY